MSEDEAAEASRPSEPFALLIRCAPSIIARQPSSACREPSRRLIQAPRRLRHRGRPGNPSEPSWRDLIAGPAPKVVRD